jgi:predicted outer membrane protein
MDFHQSQIVTAINNFRTILTAFTTVLRDHRDDPQMQEAAQATIKFLEDHAQQLREASGRA